MAAAAVVDVGVAEDHVVALTVAGSSDPRWSLLRSWSATSSWRCSAVSAVSQVCERSGED